MHSSTLATAKAICFVFCRSHYGTPISRSLSPNCGCSSKVAKLAETVSKREAWVTPPKFHLWCCKCRLLTPGPTQHLTGDAWQNSGNFSRSGQAGSGHNETGGVGRIIIVRFVSHMPVLGHAFYELFLVIISQCVS